MAAAVSSLLSQGPDLKLDYADSLQASGMRGNTVAGETGKAKYLWSSYREQVGMRPEPWLLFLLLLSHAEMH